METKKNNQESEPKKSATQLSCELCDYKSKHRQNFFLHMRRTHNKQVDTCPKIKPLPCASCDYVCYDVKSSIIHKRVHTGEKPFECYFCDKNFRQSSHLTVHERTHTNDRPYQCSLCNFSTNYKKKLTLHQALHNGKLPRPSARRCHWTKLQEGHQILQDMPYECKFCYYRCGDTEQLAKHERMHALENPFKCKHCPFACDQSSALKFHEEKEHGTFQGKSPEKCPEQLHGRTKEERNSGELLPEKIQLQFLEHKLNDLIFFQQSSVKVSKNNKGV